MDNKEFKKDFDEMMDLLEKAKHESKSQCRQVKIFSYFFLLFFNSIFLNSLFF